MSPVFLIYLIAFAAVAGVITRPFGVPEFVWALAGVVALLTFRLIGMQTVAAGINKGTDVYLFLTGMMLLAETARGEGVFDWLAGHAAGFAAGSGVRLFALIYLVGIVVTTFLSNDATAIVLTPAVAAVTRRASVRRPMPYLYICAFVANAASFVLPISNPANLVMYASRVPPLSSWLSMYLLPSFAAILVTFLALLWTQRKALREPVATDIPAERLSRGGRIALSGVVLTALALIGASAMDWQLGWPTAVAGAFASAAVLVAGRRGPFALIRSISWGILPLVGGLFVLVEALSETGLVQALHNGLAASAGKAPVATAWLSGLGTAFGSNLVNNLPAGLVVAGAAGGLPAIVHSSLLIGIDLGPNLSVTGSLATVLWLAELKRNKLHVTAGQFLLLGVVVMLPALCAALAVLLI
ncbi:SLC13 family permease [Siphonobacter aquaeclarae]|uniref:Arsenite efflux membrane protein ArsB n=1 Tax=Siphonobacter aquaeclarae TaxID=563176 RepID=A0A1G9JRP1_9BACT|nr:SLC13 family permease [Siphonobacter aquaeclarae]SDL40209.1 arsenite efflux membrane protein ArsB [Siphonobacter aquaeclarae]